MQHDQIRQIQMDLSELDPANSPWDSPTDSKTPQYQALGANHLQLHPLLSHTDTSDWDSKVHVLQANQLIPILTRPLFCLTPNRSQC